MRGGPVSAPVSRSAKPARVSGVKAALDRKNRAGQGRAVCWPAVTPGHGGRSQREDRMGRTWCREGRTFGRCPRPSAAVLPALASRLPTGILGVKAAPVGGLCRPRSRCRFARSLPLPDGVHSPSGLRTKAPLGRFAPPRCEWSGAGRGRSGSASNLAALRRHRFSSGEKKRKGMGSSSLGDRRGWDPSGRAHLLQAILRPLCFPGISWSQGYRVELLQIPRFWDLLTARRAPEPLCTPSGNVADEGVPAPLRPAPPRGELLQAWDWGGGEHG